MRRKLMARKTTKTKTKVSIKTHNDTVSIGLESKVRERVGLILNQLLADEFTLYSEARAFHWNVTGRHFSSDHALFETEYEALDETIDAVAERARALGIKVRATLQDYTKSSRIHAVDSTTLTSDEMIAILRDHHEALVRDLRIDSETCDALDDEGTTDFLTGLMEAHEKRAWILRSHLEK
jgi:starvation-inducible DNA-binding protein